MTEDTAREFDFTWPVRWLQLTMGFALLVILSIPIGAFIVPTPPPVGMWFAAVLALVVLAVQHTVVRHELVRSAVLDAHQLRARTVDGREHVVDVDDIDAPRGTSATGWVNGFGTVRHPGGTLLVLRPRANELLDRLHRSRTGR